MLAMLGRQIYLIVRISNSEQVDFASMWSVKVVSMWLVYGR